jgi:hypothetical protein
MTASDRLSEQIAEMKSGKISMSGVHRFVALLRELLETRNELNKYPLLRMFCDWSLRTKLDRSKEDNQLLDILDAMSANSTTVDDQFKQLLEGISPRKLQTEIVSVLTASFIDPSLADSSQFAVVVRYLIDDLGGKIVSRPTENISRKTSERLEKGYRFMADRFYFERKDGGYQFVLVSRQIEPSSGGELHFNVPWPV